MSGHNSECKKYEFWSKIPKRFHRGSKSEPSIPVKGIEYILPDTGGEKTLSIGDFGLPGIHQAGFYNNKEYRDIESCVLSETNNYLHFPNLEYRVVGKSIFLAFPQKFVDYIKERGHWRQYDKRTRAGFHTTPYDAYDPPDTEWETFDTSYLELNSSECWRVEGCDFLKVPSWITAKPPKGSVAGKVDAFVSFALFPRKAKFRTPNQLSSASTNWLAEMGEILVGWIVAKLLKHTKTHD